MYTSKCRIRRIQIEDLQHSNMAFLISQLTETGIRLECHHIHDALRKRHL